MNLGTYLAINQASLMHTIIYLVGTTGPSHLKYAHVVRTLNDWRTFEGSAIEYSVYSVDDRIAWLSVDLSNGSLVYSSTISGMGCLFWSRTIAVIDITIIIFIYMDMPSNIIYFNNTRLLQNEPCVWATAADRVQDWYHASRPANITFRIRRLPSSQS